MSMKLIRMKEVMARTGLGRSTVYKYMNLGIFPKSVKLTTRAVAWVESEVEAWIQKGIERRDGDSR
ncbi:helix-turn-helix transcriptional regulator [Billgrantia gudaonensis]|uniref:Transcriptional regulator, AlpA family n=1 Tax=Billgrantia gudaonensis TaxID=376427 RepID=A0A1G8Y4Y1_9GAMM|nr:AlpA family transcriptional regulator [Halomonas gudaonensis]SDJ97773.1 transcriptional regulator, AlpA family [Halomonas gudaonensis]